MESQAEKYNLPVNSIDGDGPPNWSRENEAILFVWADSKWLENIRMIKSNENLFMSFGFGVNVKVRKLPSNTRNWNKTTKHIVNLKEEQDPQDYVHNFSFLG